MEKNCAIVVSCSTIGEFKKLIADIPNDYKITWGGVPEFYINILSSGYVCLDEENIIEAMEED